MDRTFETEYNGKKIKLLIKTPNYSINKKCDIESKKAWAECLDMGVKTQDALEMRLKEAGIWTDNEEEKVNDLNTRIALYLNQLKEQKEKKKIKEAKETAIKVANLRNNLHDLLSIKHKAFSNSCEGIAHEIKTESYVAYATVYVDDEEKTFWKDYEDFKQNREEQPAIDALNKYTQILMSENVNFLKSLPENQFLVEQEVMNDDLRINKEKLHQEKRQKKKANE